MFVHIWMDILYFGLTCLGQMEAGDNFTRWVMMASFQNKICGNTIMTNVSTSSVTQCFLRCEEIPSCTSVFYTMGRINLCSFVIPGIVSTDSCTASYNTKHHMRDNDQFCPTDNEIFHAVLLSDGLFSYRVVREMKNGTKAQQICKRSRGTLARISSVPRLEMFQRLLSTCQGFDDVSYWVGGSNIGAEDFYADGAWTWRDSKPINMSSTFWSSDSPDRPDEEHCIAIYREDYWKFRDDSCSLSHNFICQTNTRVKKRSIT